VSLSAASSQTVTVGYSTANGTAVAPGDFTAVSGTLTLAPGVTSQPVNVAIVTDATVESTETFALVLASPVNATIADGTGVGTIVDDDAAGGGPTTVTLQVTSADGDVNETNGALESAGTVWIGNAAAGAPSYFGARFVNVGIPRGATVTSARLEVRAAITTWNMQAYEFAADASGNSAAFSAAALPSLRATTTARVAHASDDQWVTDTWYPLDQIASIVQEVVNRGDWTAGNALSIVARGTGNAWGRKFARAFEGDPASAPRLVITYTGAGAPPATPSLAVNDVSLAEGTGGTASAAFTVSLSAASAQTVTVAYATANGTATAPADFTAVAGTLTFAPGVTSQTVSVPLVTDSTVEANETFSLVLSSPANATIADAAGVATIVNDDAPAQPSLAVSDVSVTEGTGGSTAAVFTVTLSAGSAQSVTVAYATVNGTATAPADFTAAAGSVTFAPGTTSQTVSVAIVSDGVVEPNETFSLTLSSPVNATIASGTGVGTIVNDDVSGGGPVTATFQIVAGADDVNQDGAALAVDGSTVWMGNGAAVSYTGLRFLGVSIPRNATITSARLEVNPAATQWITLAFEYGIEAAGNSPAFSAANLPSQRTLLATRATHSSNVQWTAGTWVTLDPITAIVQELVTRQDWTSGNALTLLLRGTSSPWARKLARAFEDTPSLAPRLVITYSP
jgi:chitinase